MWQLNLRQFPTEVGIGLRFACSYAIKYQVTVFRWNMKLSQHQMRLLVGTQKAHTWFIDHRERCQDCIEARCCSTNYDVFDDLQCFSMNDSTESMRRWSQDTVTTTDTLITEISQIFTLQPHLCEAAAS